MNTPLEPQQTAHYPSEPDPAAVWAAAAPRTNALSPEPIHEPLRNLAPSWRWGWNWLIGVHYGPVPVGLLIAIPILIALRAH